MAGLDQALWDAVGGVRTLGGLQTPDDPREIRLFNLIQEGKMDEAMELYWKNDSIRKLLYYSVQTTLPLTGLYNFQQWKYMEGLVGMTGGEMRMPKIESFMNATGR